MTAAEQIEQLRAELTDVVAGPWPVDADNYLGIASVLMPYAVGPRHRKAEDKPGKSFIVSTPNNATAHHISRWNPTVAETVLDLVVVVVNGHRPVVDSVDVSAPALCATCGGDWDGDPKGCPDYRAAAAVLAALDPDGAA